MIDRPRNADMDEVREKAEANSESRSDVPRRNGDGHSSLIDAECTNCLGRAFRRTPGPTALDACRNARSQTGDEEILPDTHRPLPDREAIAGERTEECRLVARERLVVVTRQKNCAAELEELLWW